MIQIRWMLKDDERTLEYRQQEGDWWSAWLAVEEVEWIEAPYMPEKVQR